MSEVAKDMIKKRLIIHCGVQKTASTSFHHLVEHNLDLLGAHMNVLTPRKGSLCRKLGREAGLFSLNPEAHKVAFIGLIKQLRDQIMKLDAPCLVSHENLPGAMLGRDGVISLYPRLPEILTLLDTHFAPLVPEYVFYTRDMTGWKNSVFNQAVKSDRYCATHEEFLGQTKECGSWGDLQQIVETQVGADRVRFFRLEDEADSMRPGLQLLGFAGLDQDVLDALVPLKNQRNQSLNTGALEFMRQINGCKLDQDAHRAVAKLIQQNQSLFVANQAVGYE